MLPFVYITHMQSLAYFYRIVFRERIDAWETEKKEILLSLQIPLYFISCAGFACSKKIKLTM